MPLARADKSWRRLLLHLFGPPGDARRISSAIFMEVRWILKRGNGRRNTIGRRGDMVSCEIIMEIPGITDDPAGAPLWLLNFSVREELGAQERTRTSTALRPLEPESSASASSATWAHRAVQRGKKNSACHRVLCQRDARHLNLNRTRSVRIFVFAFCAALP